MELFSTVLLRFDGMFMGIFFGFFLNQQWDMFNRESDDQPLEFAVPYVQTNLNITALPHEQKCEQILILVEVNHGHHRNSFPNRLWQLWQISDPETYF